MMGRGQGRERNPVAPVADTSTVASGTRLTAASQIVTQGVRFLTNIVLARLLTPDDFGVVAIALVISLLLDQLQDAGTGAAIIQRRTVDDALLNSVFYLNLALGAVLGVTLFTVAPVLSALMGSEGSTPVMRAFAVVTVITSLGQIHHSLLRRNLRFFEIAVASAVSAVVTATVSIVSALLGQGYWALVYGMAAGAVVGTVLVWVYDRWRPSWQLDLTSLRSIWAYSLHLFLSNVLFFFFTQIDKVIVSHAFGGAGVGLYSMAQRTVSAPVSSMSTVVGEVTFPAFSRRQDDNAALCSGFIRSSRVIALVTWPLMFGVAAVASSLVPVVFGPTWAGLVPLMWILAPMGAVQSVTSPSNQLLLAKGRSDLSFRWALVYSVVIVLFELVGVRWGLTGVAGAYAVAIALLTIPGLLLAFHQIGLSLHDFAASLVPHLGITAVMVLATCGATYGVRLLHGAAWVELGTGVLVGGATYLGLAVATRLPALTEAVRVVKERRG